MSVKISYSNRYSIGGKAINDMNVGYDTHIVGSNVDAMHNLKSGVLILITDSNKRLIQISEIIRPASENEARVWLERGKGGRIWKYNYRVNPLTHVVKLTRYLKIIVNELTCGNDSYFWNNKLHDKQSPYYKEIVKKLVHEINGE